MKQNYLSLAKSSCTHSTRVSKVCTHLLTSWGEKKRGKGEKGREGGNGTERKKKEEKKKKKGGGDKEAIVN